MQMRITTTRLFGLTEITPEEVRRRLGQPGFIAIDNNTCASFRRHHIPGARHLDPGDYSAHDLSANKHDTLVFYCYDALCGAGPFAAKRARNMGFENVFVMSAGLAVWLKKGYPVETEIKTAQQQAE
jgi:rhodanese-related sulfurtransferase